MKFSVGFCSAVSAALKIIHVPSVNRVQEDEPIDKKNQCDSNVCYDRINETIWRFKERSGCPGIAVAISYAGRTVHSAGYGFADVEQLVPTRPDTLFRIASISKSITSIIVGRLLEQNKLTLDDDVRSFVPEFPEKQINGKYAKITVRSLMNHTSGIRSYVKSDKGKGQSDYPEMLLQTRYSSPLEACALFKNDPLVHAPAEKYTYSTYGFTLLSAVIERACAVSGPIFEPLPSTTIWGANAERGKSDIPEQARIDKQFGRLFTRLGMMHTCLEYHEKITQFRASQYRRNDKGVLENTPMIDNSYKWAGGGILSTAPDLIRLANHLAYAYWGCLPYSGVLRPDTLDELWMVSAVNPESRWQPGLGWFLSRRSGLPPPTGTPICPDRWYVMHTGGAVGGTTVLLLSLPCCRSTNGQPKHELVQHDQHNPDVIAQTSKLPPICVAILTNLEDASGISDLAVSLVELVTDFALSLDIN
ncbi:hypothetical protein AHF37_01494 [Paragonimus kellicotti]|nr:hypothetical protein AHF37_01494 [Paragonimus kellicotti]